VLSSNILREAGTRNRMTFNITLYLKSTGESKEKIQKKLYEIMENTYKTRKSFFSKGRDEWDYILSEIIRITDFVFKKDYVLKNNRIEKVVFTSCELVSVLKMKKEQQKLAASLLYHSKSVNAE